MNLEYQRPNFPEDSYGFTTQERLYFGNLTRKYLVTRMPLDELKSLEFADGGRIYVERELDHLLDVKLVLIGLFRVSSIAAGMIILGVVFAFTQNWKAGFLRGIFLGGKITTGILLLLLVFTAVSFRFLFTQFHLIFFEGDSWLFAFSDTLIRLFPLQFWQDVFLTFGLTTLVGGILLGWVIPICYQRFSKS
jgi:integral membrane protein (TIGR01906 family)